MIPFKPLGTAKLKSGTWIIEAEPHVKIKLRAVFAAARSSAKFHFKHTPAFAEEFTWFLTRYPLEISSGDMALLQSTAFNHQKLRRDALQLVQGSPSLEQTMPLAYPLRDYQAQAVAVTRAFGSLLLCDMMSLGKTVSAIGLMNEPDALPAIVVCPVNLCTQWKEQITKFAPHMEVVVPKDKHKIAKHHVLIVPYTRIANWLPYIGEYSTAIFEEAHELRHSDSSKYQAAAAIRERAKWVMALTGTPVFNFGIEAFNILEIVRPGALGTRCEFTREWTYANGKRVNDPVALGGYLKDQFLILRRTREDVGRQLPPRTTMTHALPFDERILNKFKDEALQLARQVLSANVKFTDKGRAARDLSMQMYQCTGIAKAPFAADFIVEMVKAGERPVVYAWHRQVWEVLAHKLRAVGIKFALYTGTESPKEKDAAKKAFMAEPTDPSRVDVLLMSLKSGVGIDGLQASSRLVIFAELHWSPQQMEQNITRVDRDGQDGSVTVVYLVADGGSDPVMADLIGVKKDQNSGVVDMLLGSDGADPENMGESNTAALARSVLAQFGQGT